MPFAAHPGVVLRRNSRQIECCTCLQDQHAHKGTTEAAKPHLCDRVPRRSIGYLEGLCILRDSSKIAVTNRIYVAMGARAVLRTAHRPCKEPRHPQPTRSYMDCQTARFKAGHPEGRRISEEFQYQSMQGYYYIDSVSHCTQ